MKIRVVNNDDEKLSLGKSLLRLLPMYYIYVGSIIPIIINSILVFVLNANNFMNVTMVISYIFLILSIVSFVMIWGRKDELGLHDKIAKTKVIYEGK